VPVNSRRKGKAGELELAAWLRDQGVPARRGWSEGHDITTSIAGLHIECKLTGKLYLYEWLEQADRDAKINQIPIILHRKTFKKPPRNALGHQLKKDWVAILDAGDLLALLKKAGMFEEATSEG
jgi:hypothetical protein